jgi:hypothetical protein
LKNAETLSAVRRAHGQFHEAIVPVARGRVGDGVFDDADAVFYEADALRQREFVSYLTVSRQPNGLTVDPRSEIWIRGR